MRPSRRPMSAAASPQGNTQVPRRRIRSYGESAMLAFPWLRTGGGLIRVLGDHPRGQVLLYQHQQAEQHGERDAVLEGAGEYYAFLAF